MFKKLLFTDRNFLLNSGTLFPFLV